MASRTHEFITVGSYTRPSLDRCVSLGNETGGFPRYFLFFPPLSLSLFSHPITRFVACPSRKSPWGKIYRLVNRSRSARKWCSISFRQRDTDSPDYVPTGLARSISRFRDSRIAWLLGEIISSRCTRWRAWKNPRCGFSAVDFLSEEMYRIHTNRNIRAGNSIHPVRIKKGSFLRQRASYVSATFLRSEDL